jgi:hypothetical protein
VVRAPKNSGIRAVEPAVAALLKENPRIPATVVVERVGRSGFPTRLCKNMGRIRREYAPAISTCRHGDAERGQ